MYSTSDVHTLATVEWSVYAALFTINMYNYRSVYLYF